MATKYRPKGMPGGKVPPPSGGGYTKPTPYPAPPTDKTDPLIRLQADKRRIIKIQRYLNNAASLNAELDDNVQWDKTTAAINNCVGDFISIKSQLMIKINERIRKYTRPKDQRK